MDSPKRIAILAVVPAGLFCLSLVLGSIIGPFHLGGNSDPCYAYLLNSLNILRFTTPQHIDNPGTPLQSLGAVVVLGRWLYTCILGRGMPLQDSVLTNPEGYLQAIRLTLCLLISAASFLAGRAVLRTRNHLLPAVTLQATFLMFLFPAWMLGGVAPSPLVAFAALSLACVLAPEALARNSGLSGLAFGRPVAAGVVLGFGVATHLAFSPLLVLILLFERTARKLVAFFSCCASFVFFTLPIYTRYRGLLGWIRDVLIHKGKYGHGEVGIPGARELLANVEALYREEPALYVLLGLYLFVLLVLRFCRPERNRRSLTTLQKALFVGCLTIAAHVAIVAKHPDTHYLLPSIILTGLLNAAVISVLQELGARRALTLAVAAVTLGVFGWSLIHAYGRLNWFAGYANARRVEQIRTLDAAEARPGCYRIGYYRSSLPEFALDFGNYYAGRAYSDRLDQLYPRALFYDIWSKKFYSFFRRGSEEARIRQLLGRGDCLIMCGTPFSPQDAQARGLNLELIADNGKEAAYRLVGLRSGE